MPRKPKWTVADLEQKFDKTAFRLSQERNDFLLPQVVDFVHTHKWLNLRPEYQRRLVWDVAKRSRFIESLLLNIPVPPVFLYEWDLGRYEVMDGQQRLNSIVEFYENGFPLKGLEEWNELTGCRYRDLPDTLQRGLNRRRLSATVLLLERLTTDKPPHSDIRKLIFDRLNTGGQQLNAQELRNCLFAGPFNDLLIALSQEPVFQRAWDIPLYQSHVDSAGIVREPLASHRLYRRMVDCEIVLRFFAFRRLGKIRGSVRAMLDRCMEEHVDTTPDKLATMEEEFRGRLKVAIELFGEHAFRYQDDKNRWQLSQPLYDAVMVAIDRLWIKREEILRRKEQVQGGLATLLTKKDAHKVIVGQPNTAKAIKDRVGLLESTLATA